MKPRSSVRRSANICAVALASAAMLAASGAANGAIAGITLSRTPAPPQAIVPGQTETIGYSVTYETRGVSVLVRVLDPNGTMLLSRLDPIGDTSATPGTARTFNAPTPLTFVPGASAPAGRYRVELDFTSDIGLESSAFTRFDVAAQLGSVRVRSFEDLNGDALLQAGEPGLSGFSFATVSPLSTTGDLTTDATGTRQMASVPAGTWSFAETVLPGWTASSPTTGTAVVPENGVGEFAVGHYRPGRIRGVVYVDANRNAAREGSESGRSGATLTLSGTDGRGRTVSLTTASGADGSYAFDDLAPGAYVVTVTTPSGFTLTTRQVVDGIAIASRGERPDVDFGLTQTGALRVRSFEDLNGDGQLQSGETGLAGFTFATVSPLSVGGQLSTGSDGTREATNVAAGPWSVVETVLDGWSASSATSGTVSVPANGVGEFQVGHYRPGRISGTVFLDANRNGSRDGGEAGRAGATLTLTGTDGRGQTVAGRTVVSGADGTYAFTGLAPGTYTITVTTPSGFTLTTQQSVGALGIVSRGERPDVDFGLVQNPGTPTTPTPPAVTPVGTPDRTTLAIRKTGPPTGRAGQVLRYRIVVRNAGSVIARQVVVTDPVPNLMTIVGFPPGATVANGTLTWRLGDLRPGRSRTLRLTLRLAAGAPAGGYANTATATSTNTPTVTSTARLRVADPPPTPTGGVTG